jgi:signal transduction histidine kinase
MRILKLTVVAVALIFGAPAAIAGQPTKDDAVAMVKKAVAAIKAEGPDKAYAEIDKGGQFVSGELYVVVQGFDETTLAHATNPKLIGKSMIDTQDIDGKYFAKDIGELGRKQPSFWYEFKFVNPATKKIQPKEMYCESLDQAVVCTGIYKS